LKAGIPGNFKISPDAVSGGKSINLTLAIELPDSISRLSDRNNTSGWKNFWVTKLPRRIKNENKKK
jgi:hypothetical protein